MVVKKKLVEKIPEEEIIPFENPRNEKTQTLTTYRGCNG